MSRVSLRAATAIIGYRIPRQVAPSIPRIGMKFRLAQSQNILAGCSLTDLARDLSELLEGAASQEDVESLAGKLQGKFATDTVSSAGH